MTLVEYAYSYPFSLYMDLQLMYDIYSGCVGQIMIIKEDERN